MYVGLTFLIGLFFWLLSAYSLDAFLDWTFLFLPLLILVPAATAISKDRESGLAGILFTYPLTASEHFASKVLTLYLMLGLYFLILAPFLILIFVHAGWAWAEDALRRSVWSGLVASFSVALGLLLSVVAGRRGALPSLGAGFSAALALVMGPALVPPFLSSLEPVDASLGLQILHFSPLMAALDAVSGRLITTHPLDALVPTLAAILLFGAGILIYSKLQSAETWEVRRGRAATVVTLTLGMAFGLPAAMNYSYATPVQVSFGCAPAMDLEYCVFTDFPGANGSTPGPLGNALDLTITIRILNDQPQPVTIDRLSLHWSSRYFLFNTSDVEFGTLDVPADPGPGQVGSVSVQTVITAFPVRAPVVGTSQGTSSSGLILVDVETDETRIRFDSGIAVAGPPFDRDLTWMYAAILALLPFAGDLARQIRGRRDD